MSLATGIVSLAAVRTATAAQPHSEVLGLVEYGIIFLLVGLSPFWAAADHSAAVGRSRAAQFVLLSKEWPPGDGVAVVRPRNDSVRLEFKRSGVLDAAPTC